MAQCHLPQRAVGAGEGKIWWPPAAAFYRVAPTVLVPQPLRGGSFPFTPLFPASLTANGELLTAFHGKPRRFFLYFVDSSEFLKKKRFFARNSCKFF